MEQTYIDIMIQSLEKKEQVLDRIIELDIKQKNQLEDPQLTPDDFDEVVEAKSRLIDQLNNLDSGFEKLFERTKEELNGHKEDYKEQIRTMQEHIRSITDKSVKIQSQEARNKDLMTLKFASIRSRPARCVSARRPQAATTSPCQEPDIWSHSLWTIKSENLNLIPHHNITKSRVNNQVLFCMLIYLILIIIVIAVDCDIACTRVQVHHVAVKRL